MKLGRRRVLLAASFLCLCVLLCNNSAQAQEPSHKLWQQRLTPEQIREALARMSSGEAGLDPFQEMVKDYLLKNNPGIKGSQADDLIKRLTSDKKLMDQLKQLAKQQQKDPGRPGNLSPDDLAKLFNSKQAGKDFKLPPDLKGLLPKRDPITNPKVDPFTDPKVEPEPKVDPIPKVDPNGKVEPVDPMPVPPVNGKTPDKGKISLDQNPFPEPEEPNDPRTKSLQAFAALWERNVGPLSEMPEVQKALFEAIGDNGLDFDMKDDKGNSIWDLLKYGEGTNSSLGDLFSGSNSGGGNWNFGNWELPKFGDWFGSRRPPNNSQNWLDSSSSRTRPEPASGWNFGSGGLNGLNGKHLLLVLFVVVLGVVIWYQLKQRIGKSDSLAFAGAGIGAWPVDPRSINSREEVVKAFEYLSVLICGPSARNWTHGTIAAALADLATRHEKTALMLARLYELARYAPVDEPLTHSELIEARKLVCSLAGVSY